MADLSDIVVITSIEGDKIISLPKREQTPDEIERTKQFAAEVKYFFLCKIKYRKTEGRLNILVNPGFSFFLLVITQTNK